MHFIKKKKIMWYWHKDGYIDQWDGIQSPEIKPYVCGQLVFKQGRHNHSMGKEKSFQQIVLDNWIATCKRMKIDTYFRFYTKLAQDRKSVV